MAAKTLSGDVFFASIGELSAGLRAKEYSAVELTRAFCDRLEKIGAAHNALALSLRKSALKKAKDVDGDLKRERTRGPLQGIPYGAKDLLAVKGQPTEWGSRAFAGQKFDEDAFVIKKLNAAGAILIGKLAMVELAGGVGYRTAAASSTGPAQNPWDRTRWAGGSSSGAGHRHRGRTGHVRAGLGNVGFHHHAERLLRRDRAAAHLRAGEPPRRHVARVDPG